MRAIRAITALSLLVVLTASGLAAGAIEPANRLTVHYHRFEQDYDNAGLWTWDEHLFRAPKVNEIQPTGRDAFGIVFELDVSLYGNPGDRIGLLPRLNRDWQYKDGPDRFWSPALGREVYIVQGRPAVYATRPDVSPQLASATLDGERLVTLRFTQRLPARDWPATRFAVAGSGGRAVSITAAEPGDLRDGRAAEFALQTSEPLDFVAETYTARAEGVGELPVRVWRVLHGSDRFYAPDARLGATYTPTATTFRVFAPTAGRVWVVTADAPEGDGGRREAPMRRVDKGVWEAVVTGDLAGRFYAFRLEGLGLDASVEVTDIYATCTQNRAARSLIVDLAQTDPPGFRERTYTFAGRPTDAVIYEMHVRDLTVAANSGVRQKGKYAGLAERGTRLDGHDSITTGLDHLSELGVTHVQIMPVQDFDNEETREDAYNWGYMTVNFNTPDGWYASTANGPARICEFKQAVAALHARGIGVIMDVVYNHTSDRAGFERLVPGYYHRRRPDGSFWNGSGCGNEFMSENPMARKFILDSLEFWAREYDVDGFRFDLMGLIDLETMRQARSRLTAVKPGVLIYGEPWTGGATALEPVTGHARVRGTGIAAFNDHFRDAIKGDRDGGLPGFVQVGDRGHGIRLGLEGAIHDWSQDPADSINYFEAHDNLTAWDKLLQSMPTASDAERRRATRFASLILLTSQGTVFLHAGQEFCRTKQGHANSYNLPDAVNQVDYSGKLAHRDVCDYVRGLIAIRRAHPCLRLATRGEVEQRSYFLEPPNERCLFWRIRGEGLPDESAGEMLVLLNGGATAAPFVLPPGRWRVLADAERAGLQPLGELTEPVQVPPHSGMLLTK